MSTSRDMMMASAVPVAPRYTIIPILSICALAVCLFLIAATIILSLIPVYISSPTIDNPNPNAVGFTTNLALLNGRVPVGPLNAADCQAIQALIRRQAQLNNAVNPSIPTVVSCTVRADGKRKRRQAGGNQINVVGILTGTDRCVFASCLVTRATTLINLLRESGQQVLNFVTVDGTRADLTFIFFGGSVAGSTTNPDVSFFGLNNQNQLLRFNAQSPSNAFSTTTITGLNGAERVLSIDFRPATGQLYGITDGSRLYQINEDSGVARLIGNVLTTAINGRIASIDFNPTVDRIRLVTNTGQNLRLNPETGAVAGVDTAINGGTIVAVAYNNNRAGAATTTLFDIDAESDRLFQQNPPNNGILVGVGSTLNVDITGAAGFDIAPNGLALASVIIGGISRLYLVDLTTGRLSQDLGTLPQPLIGLAIPTDPVSYTISTNNNNLVIFNPLNADIATVSKTFTNLQAGETIVGLDFRPRNGRLYGLGSTSRLYTLDTATGAATVVGNGAAFVPALSGTMFGFDFNPVVDRIRVVSNTGQNLRLDPDTGALTGQDTNLNPIIPNIPFVTAAAYSNNVANAQSTVLYDIDSRTDRLVRQDPPNGGTLVDIGPLGIDVDDNNGFDIGGKSGTAYALLTVGGVTRVYQINLNTGTATSVSVFAQPARAFALGLGF